MRLIPKVPVICGGGGGGQNGDVYDEPREFIVLNRLHVQTGVYTRHYNLNRLDKDRVMNSKKEKTTFVSLRTKNAYGVV